MMIPSSGRPNSFYKEALAVNSETWKIFYRRYNSVKLIMVSAFMYIQPLFNQIRYFKI